MASKICFDKEALFQLQMFLKNCYVMCLYMAGGITGMFCYQTNGPITGWVITGARLGYLLEFLPNFLKLF